MLGHGGQSRRRAFAGMVLAAAAIAPAVPAFAQAPPDDVATTTTIVADTAPPTDPATTPPPDPAAAATEATPPLAPAVLETVTAAAEPAVDATPVAAEQPATIEVIQAVEGGYYQLGYSDAIYVVSGGSARQLSLDEWWAAGSPAPLPAPTEYVKYWWSSSIYAVTKWDAGAWSWQWDRLDLDQWRKAGSPSPADVAYVAGSYWYRWSTSDEIFVEAPDGVNHKLSYDEWAAAGFPSFVQRSNEGFVKLSWAAPIAMMWNVAGGGGGPIGFSSWQEQAFPTPLVANNLPGERFVQYVGDPGIYYSGPTISKKLTLAEWQAAGSPAPSVELPPVPANSGSGRRVVYSRAQQRVWAIEADGTVVKTHLVSGRLYEPYAGTYSVYSRSMYTYSTENPNVKWRYMVRFAYGPGGGRIGFHEIPNKNGVPMQAYSQLGQPLSGGCVRQTTADAIWMWDWAQLGTTVVVL